MLAAIVIVLHGLLVAPVPWALLRVIDGLALSIVYVAIESWINDRVENRVRGRIFSLYMVAQMAGMTVAQILFSMGNPKTLSLFALSAAIFVAGAIPAFAVRSKAPAMAPPVPFRLPQLFRVSPLGALTTILAGVSWSVVFTFGPVYAQKSGFSLSGVSLFMGLAMVGGAVMQFPLGWISDLIGRRATIGWMSAGGIAASLFGLWTDGWPAIFPFAAALLTGGFIFPLYGLAVAHTNDRVAPGAIGRITRSGMSAAELDLRLTIRAFDNGCVALAVVHRPGTSRSPRQQIGRNQARLLTTRGHTGQECPSQTEKD